MNTINRIQQGMAEPGCGFTVMLQQMICHALRRLRPYAGQAAQGFRQMFEATVFSRSEWHFEARRQRHACRQT
jgi:uncharacterized membrane protein YhhN